MFIVFFFFLRKIALLAHKAEGPDQIDLEVGDTVGVAGNHWNGYSKGKNLRTNQVGLYPSFKVVYLSVYTRNIVNC